MTRSIGAPRASGIVRLVLVNVLGHLGEVGLAPKCLCFHSVGKRRLPCICSPAEQPTGADRQIGHVGASLVEDQVQAGTQPVPALLERRDARVAVGVFQGNGAGGKGPRELADPPSAAPPATARIRLQPITPSNRGRPSAAKALAARGPVSKPQHLTRIGSGHAFVASNRATTSVRSSSSGALAPNCRTSFSSRPAKSGQSKWWLRSTKLHREPSP